MSSNQEIDWSLCCICGGEGDLRYTDNGVQYLADQFVHFWKHDVLPFNSAQITSDIIVGNDGTHHPYFKGPMLQHKAKYHHNCYIRFAPYHLERQKISLQKKQSKN